MMELNMFLSIFVLLAALDAKSDAIRCYRCSYPDVTDANNRDCEGPDIDARYLVACEAGMTECLKSIHINREQNTTYTFRFCNSGKPTGECQKDSQKIECACKTDGCNGSSINKKSNALIMMLALLGNFLIRTL